MPFKTKPTRVVGVKDWEVEVPTPPKFATHVRITCTNQTYGDGKPKKATVPIRDFGVLKGVTGEFQYIRMNNSLKVLEEYDGVWEWDGRKVIGIEEMREQ
jgi:hypothetical protein